MFVMFEKNSICLKKCIFVIIIILGIYTNFSKNKIIINNEQFYSGSKLYITEEEYTNLGIERAYVIGNYLFDISMNYNPSLRDLLIAASYENKENINVYEIKISTNINGEIVKEYRELLSNTELDSFPKIEVKYVYKDCDSFIDVNPEKKLEYGVPDSLQLTEDGFKLLGINRAYLLGDYLFNLDNGYNPSLKDLLIAATTAYTEDLSVYEIKFSENINGEIVEEYNELLSGKSINVFPIIKGKYIYSRNIDKNNADIVLDFKDRIEIDDLTKIYNPNGIVLNDAKSKNNLVIKYKYYKDTSCLGEKIDSVVEVGSYGVLVESVSSENIIGDKKCVKLDVKYDDLKTNSPYITPMLNTSIGEYITISTNNASISSDANEVSWINKIEYDNTINKGESRFTIKVDKTFIQDIKTNYDIIIEYYDEGDGIILMQSSSTPNNTLNYSEYGYGGYVEEAWWSWRSRVFYYKNLSFGLTNTGELKQYTFNVTSDFFEQNIDNYVHFYFGKPEDNNEFDFIKIKSITIRKKSFMVESKDNNDEDIIGNIYTSSDFGMGFSITNILNVNKEINLSYEIYNSNLEKVFEKNLGNILIDANETQNYNILEFNELDIYGTFDLKIRISYDEIVEEETLKFSKIYSDLSNKYNDFLALNINFGFSGWTSEEDINESIFISKKLGINNLRYGINNIFVKSDTTAGGYANVFGRYELVYDQMLKKHNQNVLPIIWNTSTDIVLDDNGNLTDECYELLKNEVVEYYVKLAQKYGDYFTYYEILNEWNNNSPMNSVTALQYAEIVVETSKAIKNIDSDAKIVALASSDDIWCESNSCSYYSPTEQGHQKFSEDSWIARVLSSKWLDEDNNEVNFLEFVDVLSIHLYPYDFQKNIESNYYYERMFEVRNLIENYNSEKKHIPIWITETGYNTASMIGVSEEKQASNLLKTLIYSKANMGTTTVSNGNFTPINIEKVYLYSFQNEAQYNLDGEANLGIVNSYKDVNNKPFTRDESMHAKLSYVAINMFSYLLNDAILIDTNEQIIENRHDSNFYYRYEFLDNTNNKKIIVLWNNNENSHDEVSLNVPVGDIEVYDMYGNTIKNITNLNNTISIKLNNNPLYVVISDK